MLTIATDTAAADRLPARLRHPHGTRARYLYGCRCDSCRTAQRTYSRNYYRQQSARKGTSLVDSTLVKQHLDRLAGYGMGARSVADAAGLDRKTVQDVAHGRRPRVTRRAAFRILRVTPDCAPDHALIDAAPTWALIRQMVEEGYANKELARLLGYRGRYIPIDKTRCSVRNANRVRVLHECLMGDEARPLPQLKPFHHANRVYAKAQPHDA